MRPKTKIVFLCLIMTALVFAAIPMNASAAGPTEDWVVYYDGPDSDDDYGRDVTTDEAGNVYVTGRSHSLTNMDDIVTVMYNSTGSQLWAARYDGPGHDRDRGEVIAVGPDKNIYLYHPYPLGSYNGVPILYTDIYTRHRDQYLWACDV